MSRFFRGDSDSETESSSSEDSYFSEEDQSQSENESSDEAEADESTGKRPANAWLVGGGSSDSDSDSEVKHVVKSAKDKRFEEIDSCLKTIDNAVKINDWVSLTNEFEKMNKIVQKLKVTGQKPPTSYFQGLITLEDALQSSIADKKKMNATNARALNSMKQKIKKNNRDYEDQIQLVRSGEELEEKVVEKVPENKKKTQTKVAVQEDDGSDEEGFTTVGKGGKKVEFSADIVVKKLKEIVQARGKKNTDKNEQVATLVKLLAVAGTPRHKIKVLFTLISSRFDYGMGITAFTPANLWKSALNELSSLFELLEENTILTIGEHFEEIDEEEPESKDETNILGSVIALLERLDDEFTKSLQNTDPHTSEYVERLADESSLIRVIVRGQHYFEHKEQISEATRAIIRRLEHIYYKPDSVILALENNISSNVGAFGSKITHNGEPLDTLGSLCSYMYKHADPLLRTRSMLYHIYCVALRGRYHAARDMLLMSHLQETIHQADITTMILFNRVMCQIGISAFKLGLIKESLACIHEIYNTNRVKDLLAQGVTVQRHGNVNPEQEKIDKLRMLPFHMHINLELLECIYLTCSMLLEIPNMARAGSNPDARKTIISKSFRRLLEQNGRQIFSGPPENTRDHIIAASKALSSGEWEQARDLICDIKIWDLLTEKDEIKTMIGQKIQEEGLRTYLFSYSAYYSTFSLEQLSTMFKLSLQSVNSLICKMIWNEELVAGLDQVKGIVVLHSEQLSKVQLLSVMLGEKLALMTESNQKSFDQKMSDLDTQYSAQDRRGQRGGSSGYQGKKQIDQKYNSKKPNRSDFHQTRRAVQ